jgi:hypothetical protein
LLEFGDVDTEPLHHRWWDLARLVPQVDPGVRVTWAARSSMPLRAVDQSQRLQPFSMGDMVVETICSRVADWLTDNRSRSYLALSEVLRIRQPPYGASSRG